MTRHYNVKVFTPHTPSADDLERARQLPRSACPRRHCWWWYSLQFAWDTPVQVGCTWLAAEKPDTFIGRDKPCKRADPTSDIDHYESRTPEEDGFTEDYWRPGG